MNFPNIYKQIFFYIFSLILDICPFSSIQYIIIISKFQKIIITLQFSIKTYGKQSCLMAILIQNFSLQNLWTTVDDPYFILCKISIKNILNKNELN